MADLEELIERSARSICIAAGYEPEQWADNEDLRNRCLKYAKVAIEAYESAKQKGEAEGWVLVPAEPTERQLKAAGDAFFDATVAHVAGYLDSVNTPFRRFYRAMLSAAGER